jgi:multidrug transporter EmrE-like cation transporter
MNIAAIIVYVILTSGGLISMKLGSSETQSLIHIGNKFVLPFSIPTLIGVGMYGLSFLIYMFLISKFDLGYIIPLTTALIYIIIFTASFLVFKENFTALKIFAISFILIGLICLNLSK